MKSRIISRHKILVSFSDELFLRRFTEAYQGQIFQTDSPTKIMVENTADSATFLQEYRNDYVVPTTVPATDSNTVVSQAVRTEVPENKSTVSAANRTEVPDNKSTVSQAVRTEVPENKSTVSQAVRTEVPENKSTVSAANQTENPVDLTPNPSDRESTVSDRNTSVSYTERFRPIAASPTEEFELDAELFRLRRSIAKIEKAQRDFMVYARHNLTDKQNHRLNRIITYTQRVRHSIQPDL